MSRFLCFFFLLFSQISQASEDSRFLSLREIAKDSRYSSCCFIQTYKMQNARLKAFGGSGCLIKTSTNRLAILTAGHVIENAVGKCNIKFDDNIVRKSLEIISIHKSYHCDLGLLFLESYPEGITPLDIREYNPPPPPRELVAKIIGYQPSLVHSYARVFHENKGGNHERIFIKQSVKFVDEPSLLQIFHEETKCCKRKTTIEKSTLEAAVDLLPEPYDNLKVNFYLMIKRRAPLYAYQSSSGNLLEQGEMRLLHGLSGSPLIDESGKVIGIAIKGTFHSPSSNWMNTLFLMVPILITSIYGGVQKDELAIGAAIGFSVWFILHKIYEWGELFRLDYRHAKSFDNDYFMAIAPYKAIIEALIDNHSAEPLVEDTAIIVPPATT